MTETAVLKLRVGQHRGAGPALMAHLLGLMLRFAAGLIPSGIVEEIHALVAELALGIQREARQLITGRQNAPVTAVRAGTGMSGIL